MFRLMVNRWFVSEGERNLGTGQFKKAVDSFEESGDVGLLSAARFYLGQWREVLRLVELGMADDETLLYYTAILLARGDWHGAMQAIQCLPPAMERDALDSLLQLRLGCYAEAEIAARQALKSERPVTVLSIVGYSACAETWVRLWERSPEREDLKADAAFACQLLRRFAQVWPLGRAAAWRWQGVFDWTAGDHRAAAAAWEKSLSYGERFTMPYEVALTLYEMGKHGHPNALERAEAMLRQGVAVLL